MIKSLLKSCLYVLLVMMCTTLLFACTQEGINNPKVGAITITGNTELVVGDEVKFNATIDVEGDYKITFECDNTDIITIDEEGNVKALKAGTCIITVKCEGVEKTLSVTVTEKKVTSISISGKNALVVGDEQQLEVELTPSDLDHVVTYSSSDENVATVSNTGLVTAVKEGTCTINVSVDGISKDFEIAVSKKIIYIESITITGENTVEKGKTITLVVSYLPNTATNNEITLTSSDENIATVTNDGVVTGVNTGTCKITANNVENNKSFEFTVTVTEPVVDFGGVTHNIPTVMYVGDEIELNITVSPENATNKNYEITATNECIEIIDSKLIAKTAGKCEIMINSEDKKFTTSIEVEVLVDENPVITIDETKTIKDALVNYNTAFDPLNGISASDAEDGDLTSKITVDGALNNRLFGEYKYTYTVKDSKDHVTTLERTIKVVWDYSVTFVGHAGCYSGIMNSEEAFINALTVHGYQAIECDVKQTSDGVFVVCHDNDFNGVSLASTTYENLKDVSYTTTRGGVSYTTKICTFERYLEICKQYGAVAVVELKSSNGITNDSQARMGALMEVIKAADMLDQVVFLGSQYNCLIWTRKNGYGDIPCQYLVNSCESATIYNRCVDNKLDISFNVDDAYSNSDEWIARYKDAGCKVAGYTFSQYTDAAFLQKWIDKGLDYVTVDVTKPYEVNLPVYVEDTSTKYTVTFKDYNGNVLKVTKTSEGKAAVTPIDPERDGYVFTGWDKDITNIVSDLEIVAQYELISYKIKYYANADEIEEVDFKNKEEFLNELYTDWFNWLDSMVGKIDGLTKSGTKYTFAKSGQTATWSTVAELRTLDVYAVEKTIGYYAYKPFARANNDVITPVIDNGYFLNTEPYRTKWRNMDAYLLNCMNTSYAAYDKGFNPTSAAKVQIFFRFHQWNKGTKIASLDTLPKKCVVSSTSGVKDVVLPTTPVVFNNQSVIDLSVVIPTSSNAKFLGWYLDMDCTKPITEIKNMSGDLELYAKWELN